VLAALVLFALPVGRRSLFNQDEARFALLAREAVEHGHWLLPHVRGDIYLNKPPLFFWAVALLSWPFGAVTDGTAPLVSVVAALVTLLAVARTGRVLWGWEVGWAATLALATVPFFFFMSHQVLSDMMLTAWLAAAVSGPAGAKLPQDGRRRPLRRMVFPPCCGIEARRPAGKSRADLAVVAVPRAGDLVGLA